MKVIAGPCSNRSGWLSHGKYSIAWVKFGFTLDKISAGAVRLRLRSNGNTRKFTGLDPGACFGKARNFVDRQFNGICDIPAGLLTA